ncbi:MAG: hypothetical protein RL134_927 [Actinomycetota bacterium]
MVHAHQDLDGLRRFAAGRGGVVSLGELADFGFSSRAVARRVDDGTWHRVGRAVLLVPPPIADPERGRRSEAVPRLTDTQWSWVLKVTYGEGVCISGRPALARAGWQLPHGVVIAVLPRKASASVTGVSVVRRTPDRSIHLPDGREFVTAAEALVDSLVVLPKGAAIDVIDSALQQRLMVPAEFESTLSRRLGRGRRGAERLRELLERVTSGSRSEAEQRMAVLLRRSGTGPWEPNLPVRDGSGRVVAEIDFAHVGLRIAIEVDGRAHHSDRRSFERDRARQNALTLGGWLVLRFTWEQITQRPHEVIAAVLAAVRQRAA